MRDTATTYSIQLCGCRVYLLGQPEKSTAGATVFPSGQQPKSVSAHFRAFSVTQNIAASDKLLACEKIDFAPKQQTVVTLYRIFTSVSTTIHFCY